uniref:Hydrolase, hydrolyzing O-glycosyl compounds n=1 Tax=Solanum tuberosum TaxID=4113 RepID=M0ZTJ9_SOLTU
MKSRITITLLGLVLLFSTWESCMAQQGDYMLYKDPNKPINARIKDLMSRMTLSEKIGQMTQLERKNMTTDIMKNYGIGSLLSGGGSVPKPEATAREWVDMVNEFQRGALSSRLGIPMIYGIDAVHGHNNVYKATIFPHNVGLGATRDSELVKRIGVATALEVRATGIPYAFAPCIAVCRDPRWGRCYESYSEDPQIVKQMTEIIPGLQGDLPTNIVGIPYVGGKTKVTPFPRVESSNLRSLIKDKGDSIPKGQKLENSKLLIKDGGGFVISDWEGIDRITSPPHSNYTHSVLAGVQAGIDMIMVPLNYTEFIDTLTSLVKNNFIPMTRIDDAVRRILRVKFTLGLFENPLADYKLVKHVGSQAHRELAREAVRKSLVLLKNGANANDPMLPLPKKASRILVAGSHANNLGYQCGGWTITWQGVEGNNVTIGTTILDAITASVDSNTEVVYSESPTTEFLKSNNFSYSIVVVGELPYAETAGDSMNLTITKGGIDTMSNVCGNTKCVVVLISGRPLVVQPYLSNIDALVAAWLPGSEGQGVADVLFGDYEFRGKLSRTWFKNVNQLPMNVGDKNYDPLYPYGFGLTTTKVQDQVASR